VPLAHSPQEKRVWLRKTNRTLILFILFLFVQLILITYAGLTIASIARIDNDNIYDDDDEEDDDTIIPAFLILIFYASLFCTIGSLLWDIPLIIAQFISTKVMNNSVLRSLVS